MLKRNLIANYFGQGWGAFLGFALVPLYIRFLGVEAYALIGFFSVLQGWFALLDMGMTPALSREMARYKGGRGAELEIRTLLRTIEWLMIPVMLLIACIIMMMSNWLANSWFNAKSLPIEHIVDSIILMGIVIAFRLAEGVYRGALIGLQRHVLLNILNIALVTIRWVGAAAVLAFISPSLHAFFIWQALSSLLTIIVFRFFAYSLLPIYDGRVYFSINSLRGVSSFAGGMFMTSILSLLLISTDKLILSKLLDLAEVGHYFLATTASSAITILATPITQTWYPKLCELLSKGNEAQLCFEYHRASQLTVVIIGSVWSVLFFFTNEFMWLWTRDETLVQAVSPLLKLIVTGNFISVIMYIPYQAQLAYGWTSLAVKINSAAIVLIIPALIIASMQYGAAGAATVWLFLNIGYLVIGMSLMFRRILTTERSGWYINDTIIPIVTLSLTGATLRQIIPPGQTDILPIAIYLLVCWFVALIFGTISATKIRAHVSRFVKRLYF